MFMCMFIISFTVSETVSSYSQKAERAHVLRDIYHLDLYFSSWGFLLILSLWLICDILFFADSHGVLWQTRVIKCLLRLCFNPKSLWQCGHLNPPEAECRAKCALRSTISLKRRVQCGHLWREFFLCEFICLVRLTFIANTLPQILQALVPVFLVRSCTVFFLGLSSWELNPKSMSFILFDLSFKYFFGTFKTFFFFIFVLVLPLYISDERVSFRSSVSPGSVFSSLMLSGFELLNCSRVSW